MGRHRGRCWLGLPIWNPTPRGLDLGVSAGLGTVFRNVPLCLLCASCGRDEPSSLGWALSPVNTHLCPVTCTMQSFWDWPVLSTLHFTHLTGSHEAGLASLLKRRHRDILNLPKVTQLQDGGARKIWAGSPEPLGLPRVAWC